jgi:hypothetical protein
VNGRPARAAVRLGSGLAVAGTVHSLWNLRRLRVPPTDPPPAAEPVAVLLPVRNEARRVEPCLRGVLGQEGLRDVRLLVLDDQSTDGTADLIRQAANGDPRVTVLSGAPLPEGWWGKPWACQQLVDSLASLGFSPSVLVFVDADVVLAPRAISVAVATLRWTGLDLVSPYPRQIAETLAERLVQPLLQWSWLTTLPLRLAERSSRASLTAANGQFLVVDAAAYARAGGHAAVRDDVLDDIGLLRAVKAAGGRGVVVDGTDLATCRMYDGWTSLRTGYRKSLWRAFGGPAGAAAVTGALGLAYVVPPLAALRGSRVGLVGYAAAVAGRVAVGRRVGARVWPDALGHPASVVTLAGLIVDSVVAHHRGRIIARGRRLGTRLR